MQELTHPLWLLHPGELHKDTPATLYPLHVRLGNAKAVDTIPDDGIGIVNGPLGLLGKD